MTKLYREDHTGIDLEPFATVENAAQADEAASEELRDGDGEAVSVDDGTYMIGLAERRFACTHCDAEPLNIRAGAVLWYVRADEEAKPYCSYSCALKATKGRELQAKFGQAIALLNDIAYDVDFNAVCTKYNLPMSFEEYVADLAGRLEFGGTGDSIDEQPVVTGAKEVRN
jgi:hypothetical protein